MRAGDFCTLALATSMGQTKAIQICRCFVSSPAPLLATAPHSSALFFPTSPPLPARCALTVKKLVFTSALSFPSSMTYHNYSCFSISQSSRALSRCSDTKTRDGWETPVTQSLHLQPRCLQSHRSIGICRFEGPPHINFRAGPSGSRRPARNIDLVCF